MEDRTQIQIKVCGLTDTEEACQCAALGVDAIGLVFYPKSPRYVSQDRARKISNALPRDVHKVGVFVDETYLNIMQTVDAAGLTAVQLHGRETPEMVTRLRRHGLTVIKALFSEGTPSFESAPDYPASAFLTECGKGTLPGGNAVTWDWTRARFINDQYPLVLAGGLSPDNVVRAFKAVQPDAVDVSSGVEFEPGRKDLDKVQAFVSAVYICGGKMSSRRIF